ncbi:MAG: thioesterase family protein [Bacteroidota bacterium]
MINFFQQNISVNSSHLDQMNHVNNVVYLQWVQDVSEAHWMAVATPHILEKYYWVALRHEIDYKSQAYLGDELLVKTHLKEYGGVRSKRAVQIYRKADNQLIMESLTTWILMSASTNKPTRISEEMIQLFPLITS